MDVYLPSLVEEIDQLEKKGLIIQGTKRVYAGTSLVVITGKILPAPVTSIQDLRSIPVRHIAVGDSRSSSGAIQGRSVGKVAAQFLKFTQLEPKLKSQYVYGEHSRAVLDLVAKGEAEIGVVYRSDAVADDQVRILDTAPPDSHTPVRYGVAAVWTARNISGAGDLKVCLLSTTVQCQLKQYGFDPANSEVGFAQQSERKP